MKYVHVSRTRGDMVEMCLDHGHFLHHDARTTHNFGKLWRLITKNLKPWSGNGDCYVRRIFEIYHHEQIRRNLSQMTSDDLQVCWDSQLPLCFIILIDSDLFQTGQRKTPEDLDNLARWPCLHSWFRTSSAIVLFLNNGTLQVHTPRAPIVGGQWPCDTI